MKAAGCEPWMLCIVPSSQFSPGLRMEATMRPLRATVLRPACPATSSPQPLPRQWPASPRPPLYSPHWPIVPPCPNPRPIRWCGGAARHCALAVRAGPGAPAGQRPIVRRRCIARSRSQSFLWGKLHEDQWWAGARPGRGHCQRVVVIYCSSSSSFF